MNTQIPSANNSSSALNNDFLIHTWTIEHFSQVRLGESIKSAVFVGGARKTKWFLSLRPHGSAQSDANWISVYLVSANKEPVMVSTKFTAVDGNRLAINNGCKNRPRRTLWPDTENGWNRFISHTDLQHLAHDILIIKAEITVFGSRTASTQPSAETVEKNALKLLVSDLYACLGDSGTADVTIQVGVGSERRTEFKAHRAILAARSLVFHNMLTADMKERADGIIIIDDISADVFRALLEYLYIAKTSIVPDMATALYAAADKYQIDVLKQACLSVMLSNLTVENVCEMLIVAVMHSDQQLTLAVIDFINFHSVEVFATPGFQQLKQLPRMRAFVTLIIKSASDRDSESTSSGFSYGNLYN